MQYYYILQVTIYCIHINILYICILYGYLYSAFLSVLQQRNIFKVSLQYPKTAFLQYNAKQNEYKSSARQQISHHCITSNIESGRMGLAYIQKNVRGLKLNEIEDKTKCHSPKLRLLWHQHLERSHLKYLEMGRRFPHS